VAPLRIGIDGYNLALPHGTGVATYGRVLAQVLAEGGHRVEGVFGLDPRRFAAALTRDPPPRGSLGDRIERTGLYLRALPPRRSAEVHDVPGDVALPPGRLPAFARITSSAGLFGIAHRHFNLHGRFLPLRMPDPPAIMHWTYPLPVRLEGARNIYTLHDLVPLRMPETTRKRAVNYHRLVRRCVEAGAHICTVSEASRRDIIDLLDAAPDRVTNTYQTALPAAPSPASEAILHRLALAPGGYFLFFGTIEPKKNVARLVAAFEAAKPRHPLLIVGKEGWASAEAMAAVRASDRVILLDPLPADALAGLIRAARAVLFPSLWEGFGLPVLEAMQAGTPVLTSRAGALPEVAGDAALLVDPSDVAAIATGIAALDSDAALRGRLAAAGQVQAETFSPARYLERLEALYARVLAAEPPLA
jgi:glycosyltransferase involved in cell wall biosynthesis